MEDLKIFSKSQGASEADDLTHWDISFWSERLRESKYDINEVDLLLISHHSHHSGKTTLRTKVLIFDN